MLKKMMFGRKGLAFILVMIMMMASISGCGKEDERESETEEETEEEEGIEIPEVDGDEESVGVYTLLVPDGMTASVGGTDSEILLVSEKHEEKYIMFDVYDKSAAKEMVKAMLEEDDSFEETTFEIADTKWTGISYKSVYVIYGKVNGNWILVSAEGYKVDSDITLAVLASLEVKKDSEPVANIGKGGTFVYGDGLFSVTIPSGFRAGDTSEFGDIIAKDKSQIIYVTAFAGWDQLDYAQAEIEYYYDYDFASIDVGDRTGGIYTYDYYGECNAVCIIPLDTIYRNDWGEMCGICIRCTGDDMESVDNEAFHEVIMSLDINEEYATDERRGYVDTSKYSEYWQRGWYGFWIVYDSAGDHDAAKGQSRDCFASFDIEDGRVRMKLADDQNTEPTAEMIFTVGDDGTESGYLISESGYWKTQMFAKEGYYDAFDVDQDFGTYEVVVDPESSEAILHDFIMFDVYCADGDNYICYRVFLRPWGEDWYEFESFAASDLPEIVVGWTNKFSNMLPFNYDWYVEHMNEDFPGIYPRS